MRVCISVTDDRSWRFTSYPSEPFLSHVAAKLLHQSPRALQEALELLWRNLGSGLIDIGQNGDLISRLLWLLCKDIIVQEMPALPTERHFLDKVLQFCRPVRLLDYLVFFLGDQFWPEDEVMKKAIEDAFKDAYINFSHWLSMTENIHTPGVEWKYVAFAARLQRLFFYVFVLW